MAKSKKPTVVQLDAFSSKNVKEVKKDNLTEREKLKEEFVSKPTVEQLKAFYEEIVEKAKKQHVKMPEKGKLEQISLAIQVDEVKPEEKVKQVMVSTKKKRVYSENGVLIRYGFYIKMGTPFIDGYSKEQWKEDLKSFYLKYPNT